MATVSDIYDIAAAFLAAAVEALDKTSVGAPDRAFVAYGEPALDCCGQLTVYTQSISEVDVRTRQSAGALGAAKQINRGGAVMITLIVQITRCITPPKESGGKITYPPPAVQQAEAQMIDEDGWALWLGMNYALKHGTLHELCSGAERLGAQKMTPQGSCAGWFFTYRYPIEGGILGT